MELSTAETRVLGCLIEKQLATPNVYPLTINALVTACNQSTNREPIVDYSEVEVAGALAGLREKGAARIVYGSGQRAEKYRHVLDELWGFDEQHRAVLCVLMLRGPQTVGELRARTERLARFDSLGEVEQVLRILASREDTLARRLERAPGQKEARWVELFSGEAAALDAAAHAEEIGARADGRGDHAAGIGRVEDLRAEVAELWRAVERVAGEVGELRAVVSELRALLD